mmetsp:Transcript_28061/g.61136  ORF Transcript_28061/g.61136 Transcript_28061/m.61136 type:complete len:267 (-) Transcript_28061:41-841(-)
MFPSLLSFADGGKLLGFLDGHGLGALVELGLGLEAHDTATPLTEEVGVVVVLLLGEVLEEVQLGGVGRVNSGEADDGGGLLVDEGTETGLVLDDHEGDVHLAAEGGHPYDELDGVDVAGDEDELGLLLLDEGGDVLETELNLVGGPSGGSTAGGGGGGGLLDALLLGGRGLGTVVVEELEDGGCLVLAKRLGELIDGRGDLETLVEDGTLTLEADVLGPLHEAGKITAAGADCATDAVGTGAGGEKRIGLLGRRWGLGGLSLTAFL